MSHDMPSRARRHIARLRLLAIALSLAAFGSGCATSDGDSPHLFLLNDDFSPANSAPPATAPDLTIVPVATASYLSQGGIVYQTAPHRIVIAEHHRWATSLSDQLTQTLYDDLSRQLVSVNVQEAAGGDDDSYRLRMRVDRFDGSYDGNAHIVGQWQLLGPDGRILARQTFDRSIALKHRGYPALVASLSNGWQRIALASAKPIAAALDRAPTNR